MLHRSVFALTCVVVCIAGRPQSSRADESTPIQTGEVQGFVRVGKEAVPFANVIVIGTRRGAQADEKGYYRILDVPPGRQTLRAIVTMAGNVRTMSESVTILPGQVVQHDFGIDELFWKVPKGRTFELRVGDDCRLAAIGERKPSVYHQLDSINASGHFRLRYDVGEPWQLDAIYWLNASEPTMKILVVDDQGKVVRSLPTRGAKQSGMIRWDGRDDEGAECVWGDYRVRFVTKAGPVEFPCCLKWLMPYKGPQGDD